MAQKPPESIIAQRIRRMQEPEIHERIEREKKQYELTKAVCKIHRKRGLPSSFDQSHVFSSDESTDEDRDHDKMPSTSTARRRLMFWMEIMIMMNVYNIMHLSTTHVQICLWILWKKNKQDLVRQVVIIRSNSLNYCLLLMLSRVKTKAHKTFSQCSKKHMNSIMLK
jgi:hypothetical protein